MPVPGKCSVASRRRRGCRPARGHLDIDALDEITELGVEPVARLRQIDLDLADDAAGIGREHQNAVAHQHRFLDVVRHHQHGLDRQPAFAPEIEQVGAQRLRGQHVERRKRLVHQQEVRMHDQRPGKADALAHAAGQVPADRRDSKPSRPIRSIAASARRRISGLRQAQRLEARARRSCSTVSQGNSAKLWNTMATPVGGPLMVSPEIADASRAMVAMSPAMMRSRVDLPDPDRPSRPTISPSTRASDRRLRAPAGRRRCLSGMAGRRRGYRAGWTVGIIEHGLSDQPRRRRRSAKQ